MRRNGVKILAVILLLLTVVNCAKRGTPTGGPKDETAPAFVEATPPNYSTHFEGNEIRIYFDEYIKLKDLQKNLIISPPMSPAPLITPLGSASKFIQIEILDTLIPNTTYVFNFGNSVVDNNEGNPFTFFKYVMSTGDYIDSLSVKGRIKDALLREPDQFVTVMLYPVDSIYNDSIIYKSPPRYVTNTLDSSTTFDLSNLKEGRYQLAALKDEDNNYTFQPAKDKIAFLDTFIDVPTDSVFTLSLFSEAETAVARPKYAASQRVTFPVTGNKDSINIELINKPADFSSLITQQEGIDSLSYWYKPQIETDSLI
ncbi:MAG: Ig-like domain-containing protein, partial [Leeuwenhoekiella sp.]